MNPFNAIYSQVRLSRFVSQSVRQDKRAIYNPTARTAEHLRDSHSSMTSIVFVCTEYSVKKLLSSAPRGGIFDLRDARH